MNRFILIIILILCLKGYLSGQTKADLEEQRKKTLEEITYVDNLLATTSKEKTTGLKTLNILRNKLNLRESVINGLNSEITLLKARIELNTRAVEMMEEDMKVLRKDYSRAILNSYKSKKLNPDIVYILSARDFNQGYKRVKYLQQISKLRRNESEVIEGLKEQIEDSRKSLVEDLGRVSELQENEIQQKNILEREKTRAQSMVKSLNAKEKQLQKDLGEKKKIAARLEKEIARMIAEERKRNAVSELTPEQKLISDNFLENKGRLPWPVERGVITGSFGTHQHPVLKYVTEKNDGIDITSNGKTKARSIFKGEVTAISAIPGANMTVIIKHGKYLTVYNNLVNLKIRKGDIVEIKQEIGDVFADPGENFSCTLKFMIFEQKFLDPEQWIAKK